MANSVQSIMDGLKRNRNGVSKKDGFQYLMKLGLDEEHINVMGVVKPAMPLKEVRRKGRQAAELEKLGGGAISVYFSPGERFTDEPESANHLFNVTLSDDLFSITLDDRNLDGSAPCWQLVERLQEKAKALEELAKRIEDTLNWNHEQGVAQTAAESAPAVATRGKAGAA